MKNSFGTHLRIILKKMCEVVGAEYENIDFDANDWYFSHTWTKKESIDFIRWLTGYFSDNKDSRLELLNMPTLKSNYKKAAEEFVWNYGWKNKNKNKGVN